MIPTARLSKAERADEWARLHASNDPRTPATTHWGHAPRRPWDPEVFAGYYPGDAFASMDAFRLFCAYIEPFEQILFRQGPSASVGSFIAPTTPPNLRRGRTLKPQRIGHLMGELNLAVRGVQWGYRFEFVEAKEVKTETERRIFARTTEGWLQLIVKGNPNR